jgi:hypothetical protein
MSSPPPQRLQESLSVLETLPLDVFLLILEFLDLLTIFRLVQVSKTMSSLLSSPYTSAVAMHVVCKEIPLPDPTSVDAEPDVSHVSSLRNRLLKCKRFHDAWSGPSENISSSIRVKLDIPEKLYMLRIIPGGKYIIVVDYKEQAQFFEISTASLVGIKSFSLIHQPEVIYSIDFFALSANTIAWGLLTSSNGRNE